jgi:hypothetical protein
MYFEFNFMNIDAVLIVPDTSQLEISREKSMSSDNTIKMSLSFEVHTYYPAYKKPDDNTFDGNDSMVRPKKTKWYSNLRQTQGRNIAGNTNDSSDKDVNNQK